ncbi:MAG: hypothetical protein IJI36_09525, partial [Kiritimatiellae bacterium]|nr:hypothetical protein [Kiritimatiellia bacterium]
MKIKDCLRMWALAGATCFACASAYGATDSLWIGGASGNWNDANNWSGATVPNGADAVARIESASDVTISVGSGTYTVGAIHASGGNHTISGTGHINLNASSGTGLVEVAENARLTTGCLLDAATAKGTALAKTGLGTFAVNNKVGKTAKLNGVDVREGLFEFNGTKNTDNVDVGGLLLIRSGAMAKLMVANLFLNDTVIHTEAGGVFDANQQNELIGAITGEGVVTNCGGGLNMTLYNGPHTFSGRAFGNIYAQYKTNGQWYFNCPSERRLWVLGARDALSEASFFFDSPNPGDRLLSFTPEAGGVFEIKN